MIMSGDLADLNQWNAYAYARNAPEGLLRAIERHDRRSGPLQPVRQLHAQHAFKHARISVELPLRGRRQCASTPTSRIGASTPRSASRQRDDEYSLNYTSQHGEKGAPLQRRSSDRAGIFPRQQPPLLGLAELGRSRRCQSFTKTQLGASLVRKDERLLQQVR